VPISELPLVAIPQFEPPAIFSRDEPEERPFNLVNFWCHRMRYITPLLNQVTAGTPVIQFEPWVFAPHRSVTEITSSVSRIRSSINRF
jgi:hypothetical protein